MISDTTGVPPRIAKKNGFVQDVYGLYEWPEPFGTVNNEDAKAFKELYKNSTAISFQLRISRQREPRTHPRDAESVHEAGLAVAFLCMGSPGRVTCGENAHGASMKRRQIHGTA